MATTQLHGQAQSPSTRVVEALADHVGTEPYAMQPPLYDAVDPDALDDVLGTDAHVTVQFEYAEYLVIVDADGTVTVEHATE